MKNKNKSFKWLIAYGLIILHGEVGITVTALGRLMNTGHAHVMKILASCSDRGITFAQSPKGKIYLVDFKEGAK